jgi:hypothetical protein
MLAFSECLSHFAPCKNWASLPTADAPGKLAKIANDAAISRLRPIADGPNQWDIHRSSVVTVGSPIAGSPMVGTELGSTSGSMDTCAGNPPEVLFLCGGLRALTQSCWVTAGKVIKTNGHGEIKGL